MVFFVWMFFFDTNSWLTHQKLNKEISDIENNINYYKSEIKEDKKTRQQLSDSVEIEKFARENYFMKHKDEDIFIIKYEDSIK
jgi:cell division protein FtsB